MLNAQREQFVRRQAQIQSRTASDASHRKPPPSRKPQPISTLEPENRETWLEDREKYEEMVRVRRLPLAAQIKRVIEVLERNRDGLSSEEIRKLTYVDVDAGAELNKAVRNNLKIKFDGLKYLYKAKHEMRGKDDLLHLIRDRKDGIRMADVKDSYEKISEDVQTLKAAGQIWVLQNSDTQEDILYPNDPRIQIRVDEEVKQLFRGIKLPDFQSIEGELKRAGMVPATNAARRATLIVASQHDRDKPKTKTRKVSKRTKYTNSHLPELLKGITLPPGM